MNHSNHSNLWIQHDLEEMVSNAVKEAIDLPEHIKVEILNSIVVLLVTVNVNETLATQGYLQKLDGHANVYKFLKYIDLQNTNYVTFYIGNYGVCPAAIGIVPNDFEMHESASNLSVMAYECFPNLSTIVSVGIACGIQKQVKMFDVLVSSKVVYNEKENADHGSTQRKTIDVSSQLVNIFNQPGGWPSKSFQERLKYNQILVPKVISGVILSGSHLIDNPAMNSEDITPDVIGIEMRGAHLFSGVLQKMANIIIVRAVCDLDTGEYSETYQPTAALLAADLMYECLRSSQGRKLFEGLFTILSD